MTFKNLSLIAKFNVVIITVFSIALVATGFLTYRILQNNARHEVAERAQLMMEAALAVRNYTIGEIRPLLALQMKQTFLPQTVPAYAATQAFLQLRKTYPDYHYKEATLNPTNLRNRAVDWENDIIEHFRGTPDQKSAVGVRETPNGPSFYIARPIQIGDPACLICHSTVEVAPKTMTALYGTANGFGWKLKEVVGAQIVSVPMELPLRQAREAFNTFMGALLAVFVSITVILNIMLRRIVIDPIVRMAHTADDVSKGKTDAEEFMEAGRDEISMLGASFNRMRRSLDKAMKMLES
jgi:protein-histidine pros-kinase